MSESSVALERLPTYVSGLDTILAGGFIRGSTYLVVGAPGTGKTILSNQIGFNLAAKGKRTIYFTLFTEQHAQMFSYLSAMAFYQQAEIGERIWYFNAYQSYEQEGLQGLIKLIRGEYVRQHADLIVLDGFPRFDLVNGGTMSSQRFFHELQGFGFTSRCVILINVPPVAALSYQPEHMLVDGILELSHETIRGSVARTASIAKFRGSDYRHGQHIFTIQSTGVVFNTPS